MTESMPAETMAKYVRSVLEAHDEWDSMPQLLILSWDGKRIVADTLVAIDHALDPSQYGQVLPALAARQMKEHPDSPPYAYVFQFEGWAANGPGPPPSEREDRVEVAIALAVDVEGRTWTVEKRRDMPGEFGEYFSDTGEPPHGGGQFAMTLVSMAVRARQVREQKG